MKQGITRDLAGTHPTWQHASTKVPGRVGKRKREGKLKIKGLAQLRHNIEPKLEKHKGKPIIVTCAMGHSARKTAMQLAKAGFPDTKLGSVPGYGTDQRLATVDSRP